MEEVTVEIAGLPTVRVSCAQNPRVDVVFLHGYAMSPADVAPFAHSLGVTGRFYFPRAPHVVGTGGFAWWPAKDRTTSARDAEPRDLADWHPPGRDASRTIVKKMLGDVRAPGVPLVIAGFSQGGMLAVDAVLFGAAAVDGLAVFSASCIAMDEWGPRAERLTGLPALVAHGRNDQELAFAAGERLARFMESSGADSAWCPFEGGHEIPLPAWRALRALLRRVAA